MIDKRSYRLAPDGVRLEEHHEEQQVVSRVRSMRAAGMTLEEITAQLTAGGVAARGQRWHVTSVARILRRAA